MSRTIAIITALLAPLLLPSFFAAFLVFIAAVILPPLGLVAGVLTDTLYYTPAVSFPYATVIGAGISVVAYIVHQFIKTRIMG